MKKLIFAALALLTLGGGAYAQGTVFEELTLAEAVAKATAEDKMVFVDCFTEWCGPCKIMAADVFPTREVGEFMNPRFVSVAIDMEKGEGVEIARRFRVAAFPTFLLLDGEGREVNRIVGSAAPDEFIAKLESAIDPANNAAALKAAYEADKSLATGIPYIEDMKGKLADYNPVLVELWSVLSDDERFSPGFLDLATGGDISPDFLLIDQLLANRERFEAVKGKGSLTRLVERIYQRFWPTALSGRDVNMAALEKSAEVVASLDLPQYNLTGHMAAVALLTARKDWDGVLRYFNDEMASVPYTYPKRMIESGLTTAWRNGTPEQKEAIVDSYYKKQLENAKAGEAVTHYTNMLAFFANGGVPIRRPSPQTSTQPQQRTWQQLTPEEKAETTSGTLGKDFGLNETQTKQVYELHLKMNRDWDALREQGKLADSGNVRAVMEERQVELHTAMRKILTAEQYTKWTDMLAGQRQQAQQGQQR